LRRLLLPVGCAEAPGELLLLLLLLLAEEAGLGCCTDWTLKV
jgi:hypothetical protein